MQGSNKSQTEQSVNGIHKKRSNGAVKSYQYKGKTHELPRYSYTNLVDPKRPFEKHYSPSEVAALWGISVDMARDLFRNQPDVLALERTGSKKYVTLRIPEAVLVRVHNRFSRS